MTRRAWIITGVVVAVVVVVVIIAVVASSRRSPNAGSALRVRVSTGTRPPDAVFTVDSAGRYPGEEGWVDEGATVDA